MASELHQALGLIDRSKGKQGQQALDDLKRADDLLEVALATDPSNVGIFVAIGHLHAFVLTAGRPNGLPFGCECLTSSNFMIVILSHRAHVLKEHMHNNSDAEEMTRIARDSYETALSLNPNNSEAKTGLSRLH